MMRISSVLQYSNDYLLNEIDFDFQKYFYIIGLVEKMYNFN